MSEPMSAGEIEDVLTSIRRLVSEELRPMSRAAKPDTANKLILTSSLRVVPESTAGGSAKGDVVGRLAEVLTEPDEFEGETGDLGPQIKSAPFAWDVEPDDDDSQINAPPSLQTGVPRDLDAQPANALAQLGSDVQPQGMDGEILEPSRMTHEGAEPWAQADDGFTGFATDGPDEADFSSPVDPSWLDRAEAEVMAALSGQKDEADGSRQDLKPDQEHTKDEVLFDEAVLRDLVRDLIREELQGSLGERITRNIRKLVRVEVARALSLNDFD